jgi:hypothetical protein
LVRGLSAVRLACHISFTKLLRACGLDTQHHASLPMGLLARFACHEDGGGVVACEVKSHHLS